MAVRDSRRKPGMTAGQRMRDFSRSVMRHYAPMPDEQFSNIEPSTPPAPNWDAPVDGADRAQIVTSEPLPFDTALPSPVSPVMLPNDPPVYLPDPALPQYVVPAAPPGNTVQRSELPAETSTGVHSAGDVAVGPDGKPLIYKGLPVPVDHNPTPPALLELIRRDRARSAEVQRLKEERTEKLKAELPPPPEDSDAPRSSRIRRRGSADVDYIQTKALADKREPGDNGAPPAKNNKSPRESEQQEAQTLDDDEESNGSGGESASFELPIDAASLVTGPTDISTASDLPAVQRVADTETFIPSLPFDLPVEMPLAQPASMPDVSQPPQPIAEPASPAPSDPPLAPSSAIQRQPDRQASTTSQPVDVVSTEQSAPTPAERPVLQAIQQSADEPKVSTSPVQRQEDPVASEPPVSLSELNPAPHDGRPTASPSTPDAPQIPQAAAAQTPSQAIQRQALPEITPSMPLDVPADRPGLPDEPQAPVLPAPEMPSVQREADREIPAPSLPFDEPRTVDVPAIFQPDIPEISRPRVTNAPEASSSPVSASMPAAVQRESEASTVTAELPIAAEPVEQAVIPNFGQPQITSRQDAPPQSSVAPQPPAVQRLTEPVTSIPSLPFDEPVVSETVESQPEQPALPEGSQRQQPIAPEHAQSPAAAIPQVPSPSIQRVPEISNSAPSLPFDATVDVTPTTLDLSQPTLNAERQPLAPVEVSSAQPSPAVQREIDIEPSVPTHPFDATAGLADAVKDLPEQPSASAEVSPQPPMPAIQRQPEPDIPTPSLPFDVAVEKAVAEDQSREFSVIDAPLPAENTAPQSLAADIQRQTEADSRGSLQRDVPATPRPLSDVSPSVPSEVTPPQASMPALQRRLETETDLASIPFDAPRSDPAPAHEVTQHEPSVPSVQRSTEDAASAQAPSFDALPFEQTDQNDLSQPPSTLAHEYSPAIQRRAEAEGSSRLPFDATVQDARLPDDAAQTYTPDIQTQADTASPPIQRRGDVDAALPLPFEPPVEAQVLNAPQTAAPDTSRPASETQSGTAAQALQRQPAIDMPQAMSSEPLQVQTPDVSRLEQVSVPQPSMQTSTDSTAASAIQRQVGVEANASPPLPFNVQIPTEEVAESRIGQPVMPEVPVADQASVANTPGNTPFTAAPAIQRQAEVEATASPPLPFERQISTEEVAASRIGQPVMPEVPAAGQASVANTPATAPVTPAPAIQHQAEVESSASSSLPFDPPRSTEEGAATRVEQPMMPVVTEADHANVANTPVNAPVTSAPAIQRQVEASAASSPLSFDKQPSERSVAAQTHETATPDITEPAQASSSQIVTLTPEIPREVQRQIDTEIPLLQSDRLAAETTGESAQVSAAEQSATPEATRLPSQAAVPTAAVTPAVQRQADMSMPAQAVKPQTTAPAALPFDDLNAIAIQRTPIEHVPQMTLPAILPFDPVAQGDSPDVQRTTETGAADPFSTPSTMPSGVPATDRMDVFQALVAAGMVSRPPGGNAMPAAASHAQPLLQRSPSREAYLANMAQRQESAGAVSGPIQRALSEETVSSSPAPDPENHEAPEIDINQLASDVMRVLRGKLRSEHERLSKR